MLFVVPHVGDECLLRLVYQITVTLHLLLNEAPMIYLTALYELVLNDNAFVLEELDVGQLRLVYEEQTLTLATSPGCSPYSMNEGIRVLRGIELDDHVHFRDVDASSSQISRQ